MTVTGKPHYFDLNAAYELETTGRGILANSTEEHTGELLRAKDVDSMEATEATRFAKPAFDWAFRQTTENKLIAILPLSTGKIAIFLTTFRYIY